MIIIAQVLSDWIVDTDGVKRSSLLVNYPHPGILSIDDATGQPVVPPDPNQCVFEITADVATMDAISADNRYYVLWSDVVDETIQRNAQRC